MNMITINTHNHTYICPFCGHAQAYTLEMISIDKNGPYKYSSSIPIDYRESSFNIYTIQCSNDSCRRVMVSAINRMNKQQIDLVPQAVCKSYPEYIPEQIRNDYREASFILSSSPKAAATLCRRCLQGMIHDFWGVHEKNLNVEITALKGEISQTQWNAIDGLRKVGNIGAHMEQDVNLIIDVEENEALTLLQLIELLIEKWYIARHDEEQIYENIIEISAQKESQR